jgi:hypothetical protein
MNPRNPPVLATWLLKRMGIADWNAPLAGDLLEEFQSGRSAAWFWRQTFVAIATDMCRNVWVARRYFAAGAIGYAAQACVAFALWSNSWPSPPHGFAFETLAVVTALLLLSFLSRPLWKRRDRKDDPGSDSPNSKYLTVVAVAAFVAYLTMYCVVALWWRQSLREWASTESIWFLGFISDLPFRRRRQA